MTSGAGRRITSEMMMGGPKEEERKPLDGQRITTEMMTGAPSKPPLDLSAGTYWDPFGDWRNAAQVADLIAGIPAFIAQIGAKGAAATGYALAGEKEPARRANELINTAMQTPWMRALSAPIQTMTGMETKGTGVGEALGKVVNTVDRAAEYWSEKTGNPDIGELLKMAVDLGMLGTGKAVASVVKGAKGVKEPAPLEGEYIPKEQAANAVQVWKEQTGQTIKPEAFYPLVEQAAKDIAGKPKGELTKWERATVKEAKGKPLVPYVMGAALAGGAATLAVAEHLKDKEGVGEALLATALIGVTKAKRARLAAKIKAAPERLRDKVLVDAARAGDPAAIEKIYKDNAKPLERSISSFKLPPGIDAADVVARVMEKFFTNTLRRPVDAPGGFRGAAQVSTFLFGAVRNEAINVIARGKLSETPLQAETGVEGRPLEETLGGLDNVEVAAETEQLGATIDAELAKLPKNYRAVVEKILIEGKSYEQTAQELGIPINTVRTQLKRGKERLQRRLRDEAGEADPRLLGAVALAGSAAALGAYLDSDMPLRGAALGALMVPGFYWLRKIGAGEFMDQGFGSLSTRLGNMAGQGLRFRSRQFEMDLMGKTDRALDQIAPFVKLKQKLSPAVKERLDAALIMAEPGGVAAMIKGDIPLVDAWGQVQKLLTDFNRQHIKLGRYKKGLVDHFPRVVKDLPGLKAALLEKKIAAAEEKKGRPLTEAEHETLHDRYMKKGLEKLLVEAQAESQKSKGRSLSDIERSIIVDNWMKVHFGSAQLPGYAKRRTVHVTPDLVKYYQPPTDTLLQYVRAAVDDIETAEFFGEHLKSRSVGGKLATDMNDSIGELVSAGLEDGSITEAGAEGVRKTLRARFIEGSQTPHMALQGIRDVTNIALLGNILSAATQLGDAPMTLYHHGLRPTLEALKGKLTGSSQVSTKDFGMVNHVVEELASAAGTGRWVQTAFKYSGFAAIDQFGKNLNLNAGLAKNKRLASTDAGREVLFERYGEAFGQEFYLLLEDLEKGVLSERVKSVLFSELSDAQPISKMEMPQAYNAHPNGRILWQMKSFMLKQADVIRRDAWQQIAKGNYVVGASNLLRFAIVLAAAQYPAKIVKDWISGRPIDWSIDLIENLLETFGINRYTLEKIEQRGGRGVREAALGIVTPPALPIVTDVYDKPAKAVKYLPGIGRAVYDRKLGGNEARAEAQRRQRRKGMTKLEKRIDSFRRKMERNR